MSATQIQVGYFDDPGQAEPTYDPGLDVDCPVCCRPLDQPLTTISVLPTTHRERCCFYRVHKDCYDGLDIREQTHFDVLAMEVGGAYG